jgi:hypothetical protein
VLYFFASCIVFPRFELGSKQPSSDDCCAEESLKESGGQLRY